MAKTKPVSEAIMKLDTRAKGMFKENVAEYVDNFGQNPDPGRYRAKLSQAILFLNKNNDPEVDFVFIAMHTLPDGDESVRGKQIRDMNTIAEKGKRTVDLALRIVAGRLQRMGRKTDGIISGNALNQALIALTKDAPEVDLEVGDDQYRNITILGLAGADHEANGDGGGGGGGTSGPDQWVAGATVVVNDPNDSDSPWNGIIVQVTSDSEAEVTQLDANGKPGDNWIVKLEYISARD